MDGRLPLDRLVGHRYDLDHLHDAFAAMENGTSQGRGVVVF
jgi:Zn-dependent alcohol dehydrogenase